MSRNTVQFVWTVLLIGAMVVLPGCPGAKPAPISGYTPLGPVNVMVIVPQSTTIGTGTTQQFTASINNSTVAGVQWEVNGVAGGVLNGVGGSAGTIDSQGNYTAPVFVPPNPHVIITAVSDADNTRSGSATVTIAGIPQPATVTVSPDSAEVQIGTALNLTASVTGPLDTTVIWQVNGIVNGNKTVGTIAPGSDDKAVYRAPATVPKPATVTVTAVSHAQPNVSASLVITISTLPPNNATVTVSPLTANVKVGTKFIFTASVVGVADTSVFWEVNGQTGTTSAYGTVLESGTDNDTGTYTAPGMVPETGTTVMVTAVSTAQPTKSASAIVTITPGAVNSVTISINPSSAQVDVGGEQTFKAAVENASDQSVTWQVNGVPGGNSTVGTIKPDAHFFDQGDYTAPSTLPTNPNVVVSAIPNADKSISATASLTILQPPVTVKLEPPSAKVFIGQTVDFTATFKNEANQDATWYVNNILGGNGTIGTITNNGSNQATYTAPASAPSPAAVTIKAVSTPDPAAFGAATVTIISNTLVEISPTTATIQINDGICLSACGLDFTATVTPSSEGTSLGWYANGELDGDEIVNGTITPLGGTTVAYTAPSTLPPSPVIITAVAADGTTSNQAMVKITPPVLPPPTISITPQNQSVPPGGTLQLRADLQNNGTDNIVNWTLSGPPGGCTTSALCGTVNPPQTNGDATTYSAPTTIPLNPVITLTATADVSPHPQASTTITIAFATATISISPATLTAVAGSVGSNPFSATLQNVDPNVTDVLWQMGCNSLAPPPSGIDYNCGDFLAPGTVGPGCLTDGTDTTCAGGGAITDLSAVSMSYTPPGNLGSNFQANSCASTAGTNGMVPLTAQISAPNCSADGSSCIATVCITVTPP